MSKYNAESLKVLKGLEAVRKRPGMYIGSTDVNGLHHLVWEIVDNAMDEALGGYANTVKVNLKKDGSVVVEDNGRGIPVGKHSSGKSGVELIFTELHAGGKFDAGGAYKTSGGLHGVGSSVVNALSKRLEATVYRDGFEYHTVFENGGEITQQTKKIGKTTKRGTKIVFLPDYKIFKNAKLSFSRVEERLREASFLINGITIKIHSEREQKTETFNFENGIKAFIEFINQSKSTLHNPFIFKGNKDGVEVEVGFQYTDAYSETILSFVNNVKTRDGGSHVSGFKTALTKSINDYAREQGLLKTKSQNFEGSDIREGLTVIISVRIPENLLEFVGQTKDKLGTHEAKSILEEITSKHIGYWLIEKKNEAYKIVEKAKKAYDARQAARKARKDSRKASAKLSEKVNLSGKLTKAQSRKPEEKELFLVEGDSAGGSAKLGRDKKTQAILPLRGKVINTERAKLIDILKNEEIVTIINTIGAGVGGDFKLKRIQYGKIVIMTDADVDGAHIQTLLLTFLFRFMRPLIENGNVFVAMPPLYKISKRSSDKNKMEYAWDEEGLVQSLKRLKGADIQRYKGLGEMNADQLWETTMNPKTRTLIKITLDDAALVERRVSTLMGDKPELRKAWIKENVKFTLEDEFIDKT